MMNRRNGNRRGLHLTVGRKQLIDRSEGTAVEFFTDRLRAGNIGIHDAEQAHSLAAVGEVAIDTRVIAPERAGADDRN